MWPPIDTVVIQQSKDNTMPYDDSIKEEATAVSGQPDESIIHTPTAHPVRGGTEQLGETLVPFVGYEDVKARVKLA